jgi:3-methyladenine DNA glycosylase AlkD
LINQIVVQIEDEFLRLANPNKAKQMKDYLRNQFLMYGIVSPQRKEVQKRIFPAIKELKGTAEGWQFIHSLLSKDEREFFYFALDWLNSWNEKLLLESDIVEMEKMILHQSWWDSVDTLASNCLGNWMKKFKNERNPWIEKWSNDSNFWLNRSCLIFQLKYKNDLDELLLYGLIKKMKGNSEFFIQKAIGWSLRSHSRQNPEWVLQTVDKLKLKGLSKKEATRLIN